MAQRVADGKRIWNEPWSHLARDAFFWCLFCGADSLGMLPEMPAAIAEALTDSKLRPTVKAVQAALDELCSGRKPTLIRYERDGRRYLVFRKWQDHQKIRYDDAPTSALPPVEVLEELSQKTRDLLCRNYGVTYVAATVKTAATVSVSVSVSVSERPDGQDGPADKPPADLPNRCGWCANPKPPTAEASQLLLQGYHDSYRAQHGNCPTMTPAKDGNSLKRLLASGKSVERIVAVIAHGLRSEDTFLRKRGFALCELVRNFDGIAIALDKGVVHGSRNAAKKSPSTW